MWARPTFLWFSEGMLEQCQVQIQVLQLLFGCFDQVSIHITSCSVFLGTQHFVFCYGKEWRNCNCESVVLEQNCLSDVLFTKNATVFMYSKGSKIKKKVLLQIYLSLPLFSHPQFTQLYIHANDSTVRSCLCMKA